MIVDDVACYPQTEPRLNEEITGKLRIVNHLFTNTILLQIIPHEEERDWIQLVLSKDMKCVCVDAGCYVFEASPLQYAIFVNRNTSQETVCRLEGMLYHICILEGAVQSLPPSMDIIPYRAPPDTSKMMYKELYKYADYMRTTLAPLPIASVFNNPVLTSASNILNFASSLARNVVNILQKSIPRNNRVARAVSEATVATYVNIYRVLWGSSAIVHSLTWR